MNDNDYWPAYLQENAKARSPAFNGEVNSRLIGYYEVNKRNDKHQVRCDFHQIDHKQTFIQLSENLFFNYPLDTLKNRLTLNSTILLS